jgi:hypothetical protein
MIAPRKPSIRTTPWPKSITNIAGEFDALSVERLVWRLDVGGAGAGLDRRQQLLGLLAGAGDVRLARLGEAPHGPRADRVDRPGARHVDELHRLVVLAQAPVEHADRGHQQRSLQHDRGPAARLLHREIGPFTHGRELCGQIAVTARQRLILPGTGRGTIRRMVEGHPRPDARPEWRHVPSTSFAGSPPRSGEECCPRRTTLAKALPEMTSELAKTFDPAAIEAKWYAHWEASGLFRPERPEAQPFTLVNPPPNVTGSLHIGHALDNTLQDVVVRYERLRGKDALWVVGTDHAGIATQMVVERQLEERQDKRTNYSREDFVAKVWEWKAESGGTITRQLRRLGCSMDWSREQFTMDPHFTRAVVKVFVDLYNQGLIYRDKRLVNWDPKLRPRSATSRSRRRTSRAASGTSATRWPTASRSTAAPTTSSSPPPARDDARRHGRGGERRRPALQSVIGKDILQPLTGRRFKVIADEHADPELGSGAVKITPGTTSTTSTSASARASSPARCSTCSMPRPGGADRRRPDPREFLGLDRFDARKLVVERMKQQGFLVPHVDKDGAEHDAEPRVVPTPFGDRGGVVIEPWLTDQWYVDAEKLAVAPMQAVRDGRIENRPQGHGEDLLQLDGEHPAVVRQPPAVVGHRIPAWYDDDGNVFVAETEDEALGLAETHHGLMVKLERDPDVLDTWFSSPSGPSPRSAGPTKSPSPLKGEGWERGLT